MNREEVLEQLLDNFGALLDEWDADNIRASYRQQLYRREGQHPYRDADGTFEATLMTVEDDGHLLLKDTEGRVRRYAFKEVSFAPYIRGLGVCTRPLVACYRRDARTLNRIIIIVLTIKRVVLHTPNPLT